MNETMTPSTPNEMPVANASSTDVQALQRSLKQLQSEYQERSKELKALNGTVDTLYSVTNASMEILLQGVVDAMPPAWRYPESAVARIRYDGLECASNGFRETQWRMASSFKTIVGKEGSVELFYTAQHPSLDEGPFCKDERHLINNIAHIVTGFLNGRLGKEALEEAEEQRLKVAGQMQAINGAMAYIEFEIDGTIITANDNFLQALRYGSNEEIQGKHHRIFCESAFVQSPKYQQFWDELRSGRAQTGEFKRIAKDGTEIWIQASYSPVKGADGKVTGVIKIATDISETKVQTLNNQRQLEESYRTMAVIEFDKEAICLNANENFCSTLGYRLDEIRGRHHSLFVEEEYGRSEDYRKFWRDLNEGKFQTAEFKRIGKGGKEVWIQATYNPMFDINGKVNRIVKFASDITARKKAEASLQRTLTQVRENSQALASASEELTAVSQQMAGNSAETATESNTVASAAEQVSGNVANVATSSEELSASVKEISRNAQSAAKVGNEAVEVASRANTTISNLGKSSDEIGKVIKSITSIAQKTNLLALNAAIEAARAGEAGKGFAVVANEVKELARQTAAATEDISQKIEAIQGDTDGAVEAIEKIREIIHQINDSQNTIASAVEEQTATVNEVARNATEASKGSKDIAKSITSVSKGAETALEGAKQTQIASEDLARLASKLNAIVEEGMQGTMLG